MRQEFIKVYRLELHSVMLVFSTQFCELLPPLTFSLVQLSTPPSPFPCPVSKYQSTAYTGGGMLIPIGVGDHILQEFNNDHIENIQNCSTTPNKNLGGERASDRYTPAAKSLYWSLFCMTKFCLCVHIVI